MSTAGADCVIRPTEIEPHTLMRLSLMMSILREYLSKRYNARFSTLARGSAMSGNSHESHESPIKTPKQLVTVLVLAFVVPIILIVLLSQLATSGKIFDKDSPAMSPEEVAKRIRPVADAAVGAAGPSGKALKTGEQIYQTVCTACHATGIAKAPKFGDKRDWSPRIRTGQKALVQFALKGGGAMPARGGASDLSDFEVERAVVYMANAGGAKFREPAAPAAAAGAPQSKAGPLAVADGKKIYESTCIACHGAGVANAPKYGDKKAWASHLMHGTEHLYENALKGLGAMPPRGGNLALSDAEVRAGVEFMVKAVK
jgi:cytochrome c5